MDTKIKIKLGEDDFWFFGPGVSELLDNIDKCGSVAAASLNMGLSYSKAYQMVKRLEGATGRVFLERKKGGAAREGAELTSFARSYMELYREFQVKAKVAAEKEFVVFREKVQTLMEEK